MGVLKIKYNKLNKLNKILVIVSQLNELKIPKMFLGKRIF